MLRSKKKYILIISLVTAGVILLATTFAWLTAEDSVVNKLESALIDNGSVVIQEVFTPIPWVPGAKMTKEVSIANNGTMPVLVRVSFAEVLRTLRLPAVSTQVKDPTGTQIRQYIDISGYKSPDWVDISAAGFTTVNKPSSVDVKVKTVTNGTKKSYSFLLYQTIAGTPTQYQRVTSDVTVDAATNTVRIKDPANYWYYPGYNSDVTKDWLTEKPDTADIGHAISDALILINYVNDNNTAPTEDKWYYNKDDGYFYYINKLPGGTISPPMMDGLTLSNSAGADTYAGMQFELTVKMQAIQNTKLAVTETSGWGITDTTLADKLKEYCDD